jgi:hypothetical protein
MAVAEGGQRADRHCGASSYKVVLRVGALVVRAMKSLGQACAANLSLEIPNTYPGTSGTPCLNARTQTEPPR